MNEAIENIPDGNGTTEDNSPANKPDISTSYKIGRAFIVLVLLAFVGFSMKVFINIMWPAH